MVMHKASELNVWYHTTVDDFSTAVQEKVISA